MQKRQENSFIQALKEGSFFSNKNGGAYLLVGNLQEEQRRLFFNYLTESTTGAFDFLLLPGDFGGDQAYKIEGVRQLQRFLALRVSDKKSRVVVWEEAHKLTKEAGGALLKTLEEAVKNTFFFMVTTRPDRVLPTIRSRCTSLALNFSYRPEQPQSRTDSPLLNLIKLPVWQRLKLIEKINKDGNQELAEVLDMWLEELVKISPDVLSNKKRAHLIEELGKLKRLRERIPAMQLKTALEIFVANQEL